MSHLAFVPGRRVSWRWTLLALALGALAVVDRAVPDRGAPARTAIRVTCPDPADCAFARAVALDVWSEHDGPGVPLDVVVSEDVLIGLDLAGITWEVLAADIDADARAEAARIHSPEAARPADWFADYRDYGAISTFVHDLAERSPELVTVHGIGSSLENRAIWALRIGGGAADAKPMLITGTQHAREWITPMVSTCVADRLVRGYATDPQIRDFVDHTELWIVPVVNPDGYAHTWDGDRYWRKNRRDRHGVDLNRNFGVAWGGQGSSGLARSEVYRGKYAFSEPETAAIRDLAKRERFALHIDFHAYGQLVLYPWGHSAAPANDRDRFAAVGDRMATAIFGAHQHRYRLMPASELYPASGIMTDWMYGEVEAQSYTIELRPTGRGGFVLPPSEIRPTCDEGLAAVLALR